MLADRPGYRDLSCARNPTSADYRKQGALFDILNALGFETPIRVVNKETDAVADAPGRT
jgi:hypothetical protein